MATAQKSSREAAQSGWSSRDEQQRLVPHKLRGHGEGRAEGAADEDLSPDVGLQAPARFEEDRHAAASLGVGQGQQADILAGPKRPTRDDRDVGAVEEADLGPGRLGFHVVDVQPDGQGIGLVDLELAGQGLLEQLGVAGHADGVAPIRAALCS